MHACIHYIYNCNYNCICICIYIYLHYIPLHLHLFTLHYIALHYIAVHYITWRYTALHYIHYITLPYVTLRYIRIEICLGFPHQLFQFVWGRAPPGTSETTVNHFIAYNQDSISLVETIVRKWSVCKSFTYLHIYFSRWFSIAICCYQKDRKYIFLPK